jgi:hypothetical protein
MDGGSQIQQFSNPKTSKLAADITNMSNKIKSIIHGKEIVQR